MRYLSYQGQEIAIALVWDLNNTASALVAVNLATFEQNILVQVSTDPDKPRLNIAFFEVVADYLFVANSSGLLSIYRLPNLKEKVGVIMHQNEISDIVVTKT